MLVHSLLVEMVKKFCGGAVWWPLCPLWVVVAPSGGHFGAAEDVSRPRSSGGWGVASGRCLNSCLACRSASKSPSNLASLAPNYQNESPGQVESFLDDLQSLEGFGWLSVVQLPASPSLTCWAHSPPSPATSCLSTLWCHPVESFHLIITMVEKRKINFAEWTTHRFDIKRSTIWYGVLGPHSIFWVPDSAVFKSSPWKTW